MNAPVFLNRQDQNGLITDPDPFIILSICISGVAMISSVASTIVSVLNRKSEKQKEDRLIGETSAELQNAFDRLKSKGNSLRCTIESFRRDGFIASSFTESANIERGDLLREAKSTKYAFGSSTVTLHGLSLNMWNMLVENVSDNIRLMNSQVLEYCELAQRVVEKGRILRARATSRKLTFGKYLKSLQQGAEELQTALVKVQGLNSRSSLIRAKKDFSGLCVKAERLTSELESWAEEQLGVEG